VGKIAFQSTHSALGVPTYQNPFAGVVKLHHSSIKIFFDGVSINFNMFSSTMLNIE
jgi:hypothetical protein